MLIPSKYMYVRAFLGAFLQIFRDREVFSAKVYIDWVYFKQIIVKSTQTQHFHVLDYTPYVDTIQIQHTNFSSS